MALAGVVKWLEQARTQAPKGLRFDFYQGQVLGCRFNPWLWLGRVREVTN